MDRKNRPTVKAKRV
ncbi:MAG: hypothetical protein PX637_17420 [Microcystis sp. M53601_WE4]|nr:hypothetical protein [Microcystis sp. M53601_WE4]